MNLIIATCRDNLALTKTCLRTLRAQTVPVEILAVDNASGDGTNTWLKSEPGIWRMTLDNVSVAGMWNQALRWAWARGCDRALVVNNDTELRPDTWEVLARRLLGYTGMVTCVSRRERAEVFDVTPALDSTRDNPDFSCYMMARWAWQAIGGFDENCIGAMCEDCCAHVEMWRRGIRAVCTDLPFLHVGSATIKNADASERRRIERNAAHNREYFRTRYGALPGTKGYERLFTPQTFGMLTGFASGLL